MRGTKEENLNKNRADKEMGKVAAINLIAKLDSIVVFIV